MEVSDIMNRIPNKILLGDYFIIGFVFTANFNGFFAFFHTIIPSFLFEINRCKEKFDEISKEKNENEPARFV